MNGARIVLEVPDLADDRIRLRPWRESDGSALAAAWRDPAVIAGAHPPDDRSIRGARRWIEGWEVRRAAGVALDLVVADLATDEVLGEVGFARFDVSRRAAMVGWWVAESARGHGIASAAVQMAVDWALGSGSLLAVLAQIEADNRASGRVAEKVGFTVLQSGRDGAADIWVRRRTANG